MSGSVNGVIARERSENVTIRTAATHASFIEAA